MQEYNPLKAIGHTLLLVGMGVTAIAVRMTSLIAIELPCMHVRTS